MAAAYTQQQKDGFLQAFQDSLNVLNNLNVARRDNDNRKKQFTRLVIERLEALRTRIAPIIAQIKQLRDQLIDLQNRMSVNDNGIAEKDAQIADLTRQLEGLNGQSADLNTRLDASNQENARLQGEIDQREQRLRVLEDERNRIQAEKDAFEQELRNRGDVQAQHAEEINRLGNEHAERMRELEQEIERLREEIAEKDRQIAANSANAQQDQQNNVNAVQELNNRINTLEAEKAALEEDNRLLYERIIAATEAMNAASEHIRELSNEEFYNESNREIDAKIAEIQALLEEINRTIVGANGAPPRPPPPPPRPPAGGVSGGVVGAPKKKLDINAVHIRSYTLPQLVPLLRNLYRINNDNKYKDAAEQIETRIRLVDKNTETNETLTAAIMAIIRRNNIQFNQNGSIVGGYRRTMRKHRKNKKHTRKHQRGGFHYGKYKKDTTSTASKSATGTKTTSSLSNSMTKKQKKNMIKGKGKGVTKNMH